MGGGRGRTMEWAASASHMGGVPRRAVIMAVGAFAKAVAFILNTTTVHNSDTLLRLVRHRPPGVPLLTVSNHVSTLDDPVMWGFKGFPTMDADLERWTLAAEDICFKNKVLSYAFRLGKCIPITRGGGIYQEHMNEALDRLNDGERCKNFRTPAGLYERHMCICGGPHLWKSAHVYHPIPMLHTFPEGKVYQDNSPIRRLKWGTASLIVRAPVTPIVLPIFHQGLQEVMPEKYLFGRRPPLPLCNKNIKIIVGEPIEFDLPKLREVAMSASKDKDSSSSSLGWSTFCGLNEVAQKHLYSTISEQIRIVLENLRSFGKTKFETTD